MEMARYWGIRETKFSYTPPRRIHGTLTSFLNRYSSQNHDLALGEGGAILLHRLPAVAVVEKRPTGGVSRWLITPLR